MASVVTSMGIILMGERGECCLASRNPGQKRANVLGEKRVKAVFLFFLPFLLTEIGCPLGSPCVIFVCKDGGREEWVASGVGSLEPGEVLQTVSTVCQHCLLVNHGIATKALCRKTLRILSCINIFFIVSFTVFRMKNFSCCKNNFILFFEL